MTGIRVLAVHIRARGKIQGLPGELTSFSDAESTFHPSWGPVRCYSCVLRSRVLRKFVDRLALPDAGSAPRSESTLRLRDITPLSAACIERPCTQWTSALFAGFKDMNSIRIYTETWLAVRTPSLYTEVRSEEHG